MQWYLYPSMTERNSKVKQVVFFRGNTALMEENGILLLILVQIPNLAFIFQMNRVTKKKPTKSVFGSKCGIFSTV